MGVLQEFHDMLRNNMDKIKNIILILSFILSITSIYLGYFYKPRGEVSIIIGDYGIRQNNETCIIKVTGLVTNEGNRVILIKSIKGWYNLIYVRFPLVVMNHTFLDENGDDVKYMKKDQSLYFEFYFNSETGVSFETPILLDLILNFNDGVGNIKIEKTYKLKGINEIINTF